MEVVKLPIPGPGEKEKEDEFIARCMGNDTMKGEYPDNKQRLAVCYSSWREEHPKAKKPEEASEMPEKFKRPFSETVYLTDSEEVKSGEVDLNNLKLPYIIKDKILISPGKWNGNFYDSNNIIDSYKNTDWTNKQTTSVFLDHDDDSAATWVGEVLNPKIVGTDIVGDIAVVDMPTAQKLAYGAKFGISAKLDGNLDENNVVQGISYENFSIVFNPAVKTAFLNRQIKETKEVKTMGDEKILEALNKLSEDMKVIGERVHKLEELKEVTPVVVPAVTPAEATPAVEVKPEVKAVAAAVEAAPKIQVEAKDMTKEEVEKLTAELSEKNAELYKLKETLSAKPVRKTVQTPDMDVKKEFMELSEKEKAKGYLLFMAQKYHRPISPVGETRLRGV